MSELAGQVTIKLTCPEFVQVLLKKAEILAANTSFPSARPNPVVAVTYNNIACCLKRKGKLRTALQYLDKAREVEDQCGDQAADVPGTLLNMSTILSELGRHSQALSHAEQATRILQQEVAQHLQEGMATKMSLLAVAHHNVGVEREHCGKFEEALAAYEEGMNIAIRTGGEHSSMAQRLKESHSAVKNKLGGSNAASKDPFDKRDPNASHGRPGTAVAPDVGGRNKLGSLYDQLGLARRQGGAPVLGPKARDLRESASASAAPLEVTSEREEGRRVPASTAVCGNFRPYGLLSMGMHGGRRAGPKGKFRPHSAPLVRESQSNLSMLASLPQAPANSQVAGLVKQASATAVSLYRNTHRGGFKKEESGGKAGGLAGAGSLLRIGGGRVRPHSALEMLRRADDRMCDYEVTSKRLVGPGRLRLDGLEEEIQVDVANSEWQHSPTAGTLIQARARRQATDKAGGATECGRPAKDEDAQSPAAGTLMMARRRQASGAGSGVHVARTRRALSLNSVENGLGVVQQSGNEESSLGDQQAACARRGPQTPREPAPGAFRMRPKQASRQAIQPADRLGSQARTVPVSEAPGTGGEVPGDGVLISADVAQLYMTDRRTGTTAHPSLPRAISPPVSSAGSEPSTNAKYGEVGGCSAAAPGPSPPARARLGDAQHCAAVPEVARATSSEEDKRNDATVVGGRDQPSSLAAAGEQRKASEEEEADARSEESWEQNKEWLLEGYSALRRKTMRPSERARRAQRAARMVSAKDDEAEVHVMRDVEGGGEEEGALGDPHDSSPQAKKRVSILLDSGSGSAAEALAEGLEQSARAMSQASVPQMEGRRPAGAGAIVDAAVHLTEDGRGLSDSLADSPLSRRHGTSFAYTSGEDSDMDGV